MPTLRELRERAVLSQADLEALSGVARTTISELERGTRKKPFPRTIRKLAKALGCKPNEIEISFQKGRAWGLGPPPESKSGVRPRRARGNWQADHPPSAVQQNLFG